MIVDKFLGSAKEVINGMDRIVQSQHKSFGDVRSQKFLARRYVLKVNDNWSAKMQISRGHFYITEYVYVYGMYTFLF